MENRFTWEATEVGQEFVHELALTPELVREAAAAIDDASPWYQTASPFGGPIAPPYLLSHLFSFVTVSTLGPTVGHVHATSETEVLNPAFIGSRLRLTGRITDKFVRRGRRYFRMEFRAVDQAGRELCREIREQAFSLAKIDEEPDQ